MLQLSAFIPCFSVTEELKDMVLNLATQIRDQVDELIISEDADVYWPELHKISDVYLVHPRMGFKRNMNLGWRIAKGQYIAQVHSDIVLLDGTLRDLCVDGLGIPVVKELAQEMHTSQAIGPCVVTPRSVIDIWGGWETLTTDEWDWSLFEKWRKAKIEQHIITTVRISHPRAGATSYLHMRDYKGRPGSIPLWNR